LTSADATTDHPFAAAPRRWAEILRPAAGHNWKVPELPEVQALTIALRGHLVGRTIEACELASFSALKTFDPPLDGLEGQAVTDVDRRGKFVAVESDGLFLVVHFARGGWLTWYETAPAARARPGRGPLALRVRLDGGAGFDITEMGTEKRLALWVVRALDEVPPLAALGIDPLTPAFTPEALAHLLAEAGGATLKGVLTTQSVIAGVGNAYSDEALFVAKLSPYRRADRLGAEEVARLHDAVVTVLSEAVERLTGLGIGELKADKKRAMRVHGRTGEPCPECGDTIRQVSFATKSLQYCPRCQTAGRPLADRRLSRLLK
jgi:formamidopyrimidine-DNA glycosylase